MKYTNLNNMINRLYVERYLSKKTKKMIIYWKSNLRVGVLHHSWPAKSGFCVFFIMSDLCSRTGNIVTLNSLKQCVLILEMVLVAV